MSVFEQKETERHTTNKHILISVHRNGMYDTLHPVERDIILQDQLIYPSEGRRRHTGKQPLAIGDKSEILTGFSVALGGIGLPWGITTSSYVCCQSNHTWKGALTSLISLVVPMGRANFPPCVAAIPGTLDVAVKTCGSCSCSGIHYQVSISISIRQWFERTLSSAENISFGPSSCSCNRRSISSSVPIMSVTFILLSFFFCLPPPGLA